MRADSQRQEQDAPPARPLSREPIPCGTAESLVADPSKRAHRAPVAVPELVTDEESSARLARLREASQEAQDAYVQGNHKQPKPVSSRPSGHSQVYPVLRASRNAVASRCAMPLRGSL